MGSPSTAFVKQFSDTISLLAQQMEGRLQGAVMVDSNWVGEEKYYDQYASDSMIEITSRLQDTPIQDADHRRRMITPRYFVSNTLEDPFEAMQMLVDPKSTYMQAKKAAIARKIDSLIIGMFNGTAYSGKAGATANSLGSAQKTTVGGGLTLAKIVESKQILDAGEAPKEDRYLVHSAEQMSDMLNSTTITSADYNTVKALVQGEVNQFVGFKFIHSEQLGVDTSSRRLCYAWQKTGMQLAIQKAPEGKLTERPDKNYAWQVYVRMALGVTRLEESKVVEIACVES